MIEIAGRHIDVLQGSWAVFAVCFAVLLVSGMVYLQIRSAEGWRWSYTPWLLLVLWIAGFTSFFPAFAVAMIWQWIHLGIKPSEDTWWVLGFVLLIAGLWIYEARRRR
jgi:hypothetical protein